MSPWESSGEESYSSLCSNSALLPSFHNSSLTPDMELAVVERLRVVPKDEYRTRVSVPVLPSSLCLTQDVKRSVRGKETDKRSKWETAAHGFKRREIEKNLVDWILQDGQVKRGSSGQISSDWLNQEMLFNTDFVHKKKLNIVKKGNEKFADEVDGSQQVEVTITVSPLQYAVINNKPNALKTCLSKIDPKQMEKRLLNQEYRMSSDTNNWKNLIPKEDLEMDGLNIVQLACKYSYKCLKILLEKLGPKILDSKDKIRGRTVTHLAASNKNPNCLKLIHEQHIMNGRHFHLEKDSNLFTPLHYAVKYGSLKTTFYLLEQVPECKNIINSKCLNNKTALFYAMDPKTLYLLLSYGADPTVGRSKKGLNLLQHLIRKSPDTAKALMNYEISEHEMQKAGLEVLYSYNLRMFIDTETKSTSGMDEMKEKLPDEDDHKRITTLKVLTSFNEYHQKNLLATPVAEVALHLSWLQIKTFFLINLVLYSCFIVFLSALVCTTSYMKHHFGCNSSDITNCERFNYTDVTYSETFLKDPVRYRAVMTLYCLTWIFAIYPIVREILQAWNFGWKYFGSKENLVEVASLFATIIYLVLLVLRTHVNSLEINHSLTSVPDDLEHGFGAVAIFLAWQEMTMLIGRFPSIGIYSFMSTQVLKRLIKFFCVYVTTLIGFALAFNILLPRSELYENPLTSFLGVIVMMIGEFDFGETFTFDQVSKNGTDGSVFVTQIIFSAFIFLVSIIIANLVIGLTVNDTRELFKESGIHRLGKTLFQIKETREIMSKNMLFERIWRAAKSKFDREKEHDQLPDMLCVQTLVEPDKLDIIYNQNKEFEVYKFEKSEKGKILNKKLPNWIIINTARALREKAVLIEELNTILETILYDDLALELFEDNDRDHYLRKKSSRMDLSDSMDTLNRSDKKLLKEIKEELAELRELIENKLK